MLTRRGFTGVAGCALCGLAEFVASGAAAQGTPPANNAWCDAEDLVADGWTGAWLRNHARGGGN
jgi:hypothetical protein